jgi:hypothetical protein
MVSSAPPAKGADAEKDKVNRRYRDRIFGTDLRYDTRERET